jgi:hypothetical protein
MFMEHKYRQAAEMQVSVMFEQFSITEPYPFLSGNYWA